jgi:hypothetical protein
MRSVIAPAGYSDRHDELWPAGSFLRRPGLTAAIASSDAAWALPASPRRHVSCARSRGDVCLTIAFAISASSDWTSPSATQERSAGANAGRALCHERSRQLGRAPRDRKGDVASPSRPISGNGRAIGSSPLHSSGPAADGRLPSWHCESRLRTPATAKGAVSPRRDAGRVLLRFAPGAAALRPGVCQRRGRKLAPSANLTRQVSLTIGLAACPDPSASRSLELVRDVSALGDEEVAPRPPIRPRLSPNAGPARQG